MSSYLEKRRDFRLKCEEMIKLKAELDQIAQSADSSLVEAAQDKLIICTLETLYYCNVMDQAKS